MSAGLIERYAENMHGVLSCYDRIIITGTLPGACYAEGMTSFLYAKGIRIFDYARFAEPLRERIRTRAQEVGAAAGVPSSMSTRATSAKRTWWHGYSRSAATRGTGACSVGDGIVQQLQALA